ncbi:MAG: hypothetical protein IPL12_10245 [Bacteroidetes bacterium]|nr:hypothetical protein [Bacteroidota bacterium]
MRKPFTKCAVNLQHNLLFMIDPNIKIAATPTGAFYLSDETYAAAKEKYLQPLGNILETHRNIAKPVIYIQLILCRVV